MSSVLRNWVQVLSWKQQSVLLSGLRGPDTIHCPNVKIITRWLRNVVQNNVDPTYSYMMISDLPGWGLLEKELEYCSVHYVHHLTQALMVMAHNCTMPEAQKYAYWLVNRIADDLLHMTRETPEHFFVRLEDKVSHE